MGTWSASIFGNDTSCEIKEMFFEKYNNGVDVHEIKREILHTYSADISDEKSETKTDILFALAYCLWETQQLDKKLLDNIEKIISSGEDIAICTGLGADKYFIKSREVATKKLLNKISIPRATVKKRIKPPVQIDSIYRNGVCMAFQYSNGVWGCLISVETKHFNRKIEGYYLLTDLKSKTIPTMEKILKAHISDDSYHRSTFEFHYNRFTSMIFNWVTSKEINNFYKYNEQFFTIIGYLPAWENCYGGGSGGLDYYCENYEEFKIRTEKSLAYNLKARKCTVSTIEMINTDFESRKPR